MDLLKFCLNDDKGADISGAPLAVLADGRLHTFGFFKANSAFLATDDERKIFPRFTHWFIDKEFSEECELVPIPLANVFKLDVDKILDFRNGELNATLALVP